ncbi:hypothetical protein [Micromonospora musae]|uniref:hypothetical protein n=1 Tax=Micromonospora musae TaxID=1894970 RepID=UPI00342FC85C
MSRFGLLEAMAVLLLSLVFRSLKVTIPDDCAHFDCYGYNPSTGRPHGCGSTDNVSWGQENHKTSTKPKPGKYVPPARTKTTPKHDKCQVWSWICDAGRSINKAYHVTGDYLSENWGTISKGLVIVGGVVCIVASAGTCTVVAGAALAGSIFVDGYQTNWDISEMDWRSHAIDAAFILAGAGLARGVAGSFRSYWREVPWKFNPEIGAKMPTRTMELGNAISARAPMPVINAGYRADDFVAAVPSLSYAMVRSKEIINTFDAGATLPGLSANASMWAATNGPDIW